MPYKLKLFSSIFLIYSILLFSLIKGSTLENGFSDNVIQKVFHRKDVPRHEFISIKTLASHRSKREIRPVEIRGCEGNTFYLNLSPIRDNSVDRNIPVWSVKTETKSNVNHSYQKINTKHLQAQGVYYKDAQNSAVLLAYYKEGYIFYDGVVGEAGSTKVVRSVPEKWWKVTGSKNHIIYDSVGEGNSTQALNGDYGFVPGELDEPLKVMYPKLLIIVEHTLFKTLGEDVDETVRYVSTFWNAVNLKYEDFTNPKVKVMITGIIIEKDLTALKYIYDSLNKTDMSRLQDSPIDRQRKYFIEDFPLKKDFSNYDATITMLNLDAGAIAGQAYPGQICGSEYNVGFIKDDGNFGGLRPGIHELGHLLNMHHDGMGNSKNCSAYPSGKVQSVMAAADWGYDKSVWSECSKDVLKKFSWLKRAECLKDRRRDSRL